MKKNWNSRIVGHEDIDPKKLEPNPDNWRLHPTFQQRGLKAVLDKVGYVQSVIVNKRTGKLVDGHLRVEMSLNEGIKKIPVSFIDVSEEEEKLILATLDPLAALADTDEPMLHRLVDSLQKNFGEVLSQIDLPSIEDVIGDTSIPTDFKEFDDSIETNTECPQCGYTWSEGKK